jgi:hypothetical protein
VANKCRSQLQYDYRTVPVSYNEFPQIKFLFRAAGTKQVSIAVTLYSGNVRPKSQPAHRPS